MKSIDFKGSNSPIGFSQKEYNGIYSHKQTHPDFTGMDEITMCFELDEAELKQVQETGCIWLKRLQPKKHDFHPIGPGLLKPEGFEKPVLEKEDSPHLGGDVRRTEGVEFSPETFDIKTVDFTKVNYFFKKQAAIHLKLKFEGKSEKAHTNALLEAQKSAMINTANPVI